MPTFTKWLVPIATLLLEIPIGVCPACGLPASHRWTGSRVDRGTVSIDGV